MRPIKVYLAGKIPKGDEIGNLSDWRNEYITLLKDCEISFISPENPDLDESQPLLVFGHDCVLVREADIIVINAPDKLGVGTAQEMIIAKYFGKYVYTVLPPDTHHRRTNLNMHGRIIPDWIHPFVYAFSDKIFNNIHELVVYIKDNRKGILDT